MDNRFNFSKNITNLVKSKVFVNKNTNKQRKDVKKIDAINGKNTNDASETTVRNSL